MSEPTLSDIMIAIKELRGRIDSVDSNLSNRIDSVESNLSKRIDTVEKNLTERIDRVEQAVREVKNDHNDLGYIQDRLLQQDKMIWRIRKELKMTSGE